MRAHSRAIAANERAARRLRQDLEDARWLREMSQRLAQAHPGRRDAARELPRHSSTTKRCAPGLDPQLVLGVIHLESGFKKYAVSNAGARGYMQVMPFWVKR